MKNWFWIPLAAIVGGIAGAWGPREDLEKFKDGVREERTQKKVSGATGFDAFARLVRICSRAPIRTMSEGIQPFRRMRAGRFDGTCRNVVQ